VTPSDERFAVETTNSAWRVVGGEVVIINAETTYYYSLNESGSRVWKLLLEHELSVEEIATSLGRVYALPGASIRSDVSKLVEQLCTEQLLVRSSAGERELTQANGVGSEDLAAAGPYVAPDLVKYDTLEELVVSGE